MQNSFLAQSQLSVQKSLKLPVDFDLIEVDNQGYIYIVYKDQISKLDQDGKEMYHYSNKSLGSIHQLDVTNTLRPLVFYKDQGLLVFLDNTLSQQENIINFNELELYQSNCVANSNFDNGVWLYDVDVNEIIKINTHSKIQFRSGNLTVLINGLISPIKSLYEKNKRLFALSDETVLVFDQYGSLLKKFDLICNNGAIYGDEAIIGYNGKAVTHYKFIGHELITLKTNRSFDELIGFPGNILGINRDSATIYYLELK